MQHEKQQDRSYQFQINSQELSSSDPTLTGAQLKLLGGVPTNHVLFKVTPEGHKDKRIDDQDTVNLSNPEVERFYSLTPEQAAAKDPYRFHVDGQKFETVQAELTGLQIKQIASVDISYQLYLEGNTDRQIRDAEPVDFRAPGTEHFYTTPPANFGEDK